MKDFMPELPPQERLRILRDSCDSHEQTTYYKDLTADEVAAKNSRLIDNLIVVSRAEDELIVVKKEHKIKTDPLKDENKIILMEVKTGKQEITGTIYHLANHDEGIMETYDENGEFVKSRRLRPDEKQGRLFIADNSKSETA